ncbi:hypothetical protein G6O69_26845 [Pseudenhygromyxa sp. WMMC2535]|uniref:hypothetical protein n=1 Tax=Pseudenhygromyxa sp. WMMC2535 TaxID=2712867 RepID=UPI001553D533|nr:hypothetical protein [Pseudenhygromyxa sp. WMMC2535]NVB41485.1 hypothetical protein [Pseudenhygromyxa sp. WMMC2535]
MFRARWLRTLTLSSLLLGAALPLGACNKGDLVATSVPAEGVSLRYDLAPGATLDGTVSRRETLSSRGAQMTRSLAFTVQLVVQSLDEKGNALVAATIDNIEIDWNMPNMPISMAEFNAQSKQRLEGATIRFFVDPSGRVFDVPAPPPDLQEAEAQVLEGVLEGLTSAFFVVPEDQLGAGETWENDDTRGREGKLGKYIVDNVRGQLEGLYQHRETNQRLAKLIIDRDRTETTTTKDGSSEIRVREATSVLFDVDAKYMSAIESKMTRSQGATTTSVRFQADWTRSVAGKSPGGAAVAPAEGADVQQIADPCSDDYVGPEDCADPCSVNYMGDEACDEGEGDAASTDEAGGAGEAGEAAEDDAGEDSDAAAEDDAGEDSDAAAGG